MGKEKAEKWPADYRVRRIAEILGPTFRPTPSAEIAKKMRRSSGLVEFYLRSMSQHLQGRFVYNCVYRLGPHLWAISSQGQGALGLDQTAQADFAEWIAVHCDAFIEGADLREEALDAFKWTSWRALKGDPIVTAVAEELARHPWVSSTPPRSKAIGVFGQIVRQIDDENEARRVLAAVKTGADTDAKFSNWLARTGSAALHLMDAGAKQT